MAARTCAICGAFLDAPRENPNTRRLARKCSQCLEWHPISPT